MAGDGSTGKRSVKKGTNKTVVTYKTKGNTPTRVLTITPRGVEQFRSIPKKKKTGTKKTTKKKVKDKYSEHIEVVNVKGRGRMYQIHIEGQNARRFKKREDAVAALRAEAEI